MTFTLVQIQNAEKGHRTAIIYFRLPSSEFPELFLVVFL